mmetsp:Transcript_5217/g.9447  ORF Transcript_5217/g.9447 Transcript_5217/m.9447 type:complete len:445 (-) Transcript_5217:56-1390(-)
MENPNTPAFVPSGVAHTTHRHFITSSTSRFVPYPDPHLHPHASTRHKPRIFMASGSSKNKKGNNDKKNASLGFKGFGGLKEKDILKSNNVQPFSLIRERKIQDLFRWLQVSGAAVSKIGVANISIADDEAGKRKTMRGVVALEPIVKGDVIVSVPERLALEIFVDEQLDQANPGYAAADLLRAMIDTKDFRHAKYAALFGALPGMEDCTTTDFYTEQELDALEWAPVKTETRKRLEKVRQAYAFVDTLAEEEGVATLSQLVQSDYNKYLWAIFIVVSRVIGIHKDEFTMARYLIPVIDMFNHHNDSKHELSNRNGEFRVIAGSDIEIGEQINIRYGGGLLGNDRIIQDYGFVEVGNPEKPIMASLVKAGSRLAGGSSDINTVRKQVRSLANECLSAFSCSVEEDDVLLENPDLSLNMRNAILFRRNIKKALNQYMNEDDKRNQK